MARNKITKEDIIREFQEFYTTNGRSPKMSDQKQLSFSKGVVKRRIGGWTEALRQAGLPVNKDMTVYHVHCLYCEKPIERNFHSIQERGINQFCNLICSNTYHGKKRTIKRYCLYCEKELSRQNKKYCNQTCAHTYRRRKYIEGWLSEKETGTKGTGNGSSISSRVRNYLLEQTEHKCSICGWGERNPYTNTIPLEIDHIDGNWKNNSPDNLRVLCPNCHSLTATHKGANRGNGTEKRKYSGNRGNYWKESM